MEKARLTLYATVGLYLIYLAYSLATEVPKTEGSQQVFCLVFAILFGLIGIGCIIFGGYMTYKLRKKDGTEK